MTQIAELNKAVRELNELWQVCTDDAQSEQLLMKRDELDTQAQQLANKIIQEGNDDLNSAIAALNELTEQALSAKNEINDIARKIEKTASAIDKATKAITKVAVLLA